MVRPTRPLVTAPLARNTELTIEHLSADTIVYYLQTNRIRCLNQTLAFVWQQCDGHTTVEQIVERLPDVLNLPPDQEIALVALKQLNKLHLLRGELPNADASGLPSRRELAKRLAYSGAAAALIRP